MDNANIDAPPAAPNPQHDQVIAMFPDLDLENTIREHGALTSEELASWIVDHRDEIPKRRAGIRVIEPPRAEINHSDETLLAEGDVHADGDLLVDKFFMDLIRKLMVENQKKKTLQIQPGTVLKDRQAIKNYLCDQFPRVRMDFVHRLIHVFDLAVVPCAIACFFADNNFANKLQKLPENLRLAPNTNQTFWLKSAKATLIPRKRQFGGYKDQLEALAADYQRYKDIMAAYRKGEYQALITEKLKICQNYKSIKWELSEKEKETAVECVVCLELFPANRMINCTIAPTAQQQQESYFAATDGEEEEDEAGPSTSNQQDDEDEPGPSTSKQQDHEDEPGPSTSNYKGPTNCWYQEEEDGDEDEEEEDKPCTSNEQRTSPPPPPPPHINSAVHHAEEENVSSAPPQVHAFCRSCVRGHAEAATTNQPLADGGVGLRCMASDCKNPILYSGVRPLLSREIRKKLDERIFEENIGMASLHNLERCKRCNFAMEFDMDKTVNKVFDCRNCGAKFCRNCQEDWDDDHFGKNCDEVAVKLKKNRKFRDLEKQLNEAVMRKCPRCGIVFMKSEGCNKMTCRCGMTQCYLCRESKIDYTHFCQHVRDPQQPRCLHCNKPCLLYEDPNRRDEQLINEIRQRNVATREIEPEEQPAAPAPAEAEDGPIASEPTNSDDGSME